MSKLFEFFGSRIFMLGFVFLSAVAVSACQTLAETSETAEEETMMAMMEQESAEEVMAMPLVVSDDVYVVAAGDSLWSISGMSSIYNDSFRWPLIYQRNDSIEDADLIFPGQELAIRRDLSRADIDAAINHAKNRGAWSIGEIEETDLQYRSNAMN